MANQRGSDDGRWKRRNDKDEVVKMVVKNEGSGGKQGRWRKVARDALESFKLRFKRSSHAKSRIM